MNPTSPTWDCADAKMSLGVYVLGAIDPAERALVDAHLATCRDCRDELAGLAGLPALLARVNPDEVSRIRADDAVRTGVVSMAHGWGSLPGETVYERDGANTGLLISTSRNLDPINAMPRMSAVPVNLEALRPTTAAPDLRGESNTQV